MLNGSDRYIYHFTDKVYYRKFKKPSKNEHFKEIFRVSDIGDDIKKLIANELSFNLKKVLYKFFDENKHLTPRLFYNGMLEGILIFNALSIEFFSQLPIPTESKDQYLKDFLPECLSLLKEKLEALPSEEIKTMLAVLKTH